MSVCCCFPEFGFSASLLLLRSVGVPIFVVGGVDALGKPVGTPAPPLVVETGVPEAEPTEVMTPPPVIGVSPV